MKSIIVWVDIPVSDLDRAIRFYSKVLAIQVKREDFPGMSIAVFHPGENESAGCLFLSEDPIRNENGPLIYFRANNRLDEALSLVEELGGRIQQPKHAISPYGFRAIIHDSEGNRIALHSN